MRRLKIKFLYVSRVLLRYERCQRDSQRAAVTGISSMREIREQSTLAKARAILRHGEKRRAHSGGKE